MHADDLIPAGEFCSYHQVEISFIRDLYDLGLAGVSTEQGLFLSISELPNLEKFVRWHYEMAINPEGIEAIAHLLERVGRLQEENRILHNKLRGYEFPTPGKIVEGEI